MEKLLAGSRFLVLITVAICLIGALALYASGVLIVANLLLDLLSGFPVTTDAGKEVAVTLLKTLDLLLIAVTFQIIGVGLFRLFVREHGELPPAMRVADFNELKASVIRLSIVVLVILFVEQTVELGPSIEVLYFGVAIAMVVGVAVLAADRMGASH